MILLSLTLSHKCRVAFFSHLEQIGLNVCCGIWARAQRQRKQCFQHGLFSEMWLRWHIWTMSKPCRCAPWVWGYGRKQQRQRVKKEGCCARQRELFCHETWIRQWTVPAAVAAAVLQIAPDSQRLCAMNEWQTEWMNGEKIRQIPHSIHPHMLISFGNKYMYCRIYWSNSFD